MGFAQLYYTSCETGLSGFAGFQFNAVTPGLPPGVLRAVESLTSYTPPRWLSAQPTAAEIAACPVNLVYTTAPVTILARVVFTGTDFSRRSGNYFAHALVGRGDDAFAGILPIELWDAPVWASAPVAVTDLPALEALTPPAPELGVSREDVGRFLAAGAPAGHLAALLTAAEDAILRSGRAIVIVGPDTAVIARWIAAICFLLPPAAARRLSFATYHHNPACIDVHVIGTPPDSEFDLDETAFRSYVVLDLTTARISEVAAQPAAALLARAGPRRAAALWRVAGEVAEITGDTLTDWHPALVMAALLGGPEVTIADLDVLGHWLRHHAERVCAGQRGEIGRRFTQNAACRPQHLAGLAELGRLTAGSGLTACVERMAVHEELRRAVAGADISTGVPIVTAEGRALAAAECAGRLADAPAPAAISLLGWSTDLGLTLPETVLRACGEHVLGPRLAGPPDDDTLGVIAGARPLTEGALAYLAGLVAERPDTVARAFAAGLGDIAGTFPGVVPDVLRETALLARVRTHPEDRIRAVTAFAATTDGQAGGGWLTADLMRRIWPDGRWTTAEALRAARAFRQEQLLSEPVHGWMVRAIVAPARETGYLTAYEELCQVLGERAIDRTLPEQARRQLDSFLTTLTKIKQAQVRQGKAQASIIRQLAGSYPGLTPPAQDLLRAALAAQVEKLAASPHLPAAIETYPEPVVSTFLGVVHCRLAATPPDAAAAARLWHCLVSLLPSRDVVIAPGLERAMREELRLWRRADLNRVQDMLHRADPGIASQFADWRRRRLSTGLRRSWRRMLTGHAEGGP